MGDHPRPCGEKLLADGAGAKLRGSPPPMRGKGYCAVPMLGRLRITPAHAGKRAIAALNVFTTRDHPRPCGEKVLFIRPRKLP